MENIFPTRLKITKLLNSIIVLKQLDGSEFFVAAPRAIVIGIRSLTMILHFLIMNELFDHQILEGILEEYHSSRERSSYNDGHKKVDYNDQIIDNSDFGKGGGG